VRKSGSWGLTDLVNPRFFESSPAWIRNFRAKLSPTLVLQVGLLEQEPQLDKSKTVKEIVEEGVADVVRLLKEFEAINEKFGDPAIMENPDAMDKLITNKERSRKSSML
jgi:ATPase subunit of ABC transporter with duplicated ATPase domains